MIGKIKTAVRGKKTYLLAIGAIIGSVVAWSEDMMGTLDLIKALFTAAGMMTLRAGITTEARKIEEKVQ